MQFFTTPHHYYISLCKTTTKLSSNQAWLIWGGKWKNTGYGHYGQTWAENGNFRPKYRHFLSFPSSYYSYFPQIFLTTTRPLILSLSSTLNIKRGKNFLKLRGHWECIFFIKILRTCSTKGEEIWTK